MNVLIFMASPNKNGNTAKLVESFIKGVDGNINIIYPYEENIKPCIDCRYCYIHNGKCSIKDSMNYIYKKIDMSDVIVIASPMYFASFTSPMKSIIDRMQVYWSKKCIFKEENKSKKKGLLFITAGSEWSNMFIPMENMIRYVFKFIDTEFIEGIYVPNTDLKKVSDNKEILDVAYKLGERISKK